MDVLSVLPQIQVALAGVGILARILLQLAIRHDRVAQRSGAPGAVAASPARPGRATRSLQVAIAVGQTAGAVIIIVAWLHTTGLL